MDKNVPLDVSGDQLADHGIGEDAELSRSLRDNGGARREERYFRAENERPETVKEAVQYVLGIFFHPPLRVWLDGNPVEVTDEHLDGIRKPTV